MKLEISKSYLLTTAKQTIIKRKVKIVGLLTYEQALKLPYNIQTLAINEKVIDSAGEDSTYLQRQIYYYCKVLDEKNAEVETSEILLVWDDIIDASMTTELKIEYNLKLLCSINPNSDIAIKEVLDTITNTLSNTYGSQLTSQISIENVSSNNTIENNTNQILNSLTKTQEVLQEAMNTLLSLITLKTGTEDLITKINNLNISTNLTSMSDTINTILQQVNMIYKKVK